MEGELVVPGDVLCDAGSWASGPGTMVARGSVVSTLAGRVRAEGGAVRVEARSGAGGEAATPAPGDVVLARVTRVEKGAARLAVLAIGAAPVRGEFGAAIRAADVRAAQAEGVAMARCFRPGDVVRAQVLSLGDKRHFFLSTQGNELGVVGARSAVSGLPMVAVSWEAMKCPLTGTVEPRKVAAPTAQQK